MVNIISKKSRPLEEKTKDHLHNRRKQLATELKDGIFSQDQMMQRDCKSEAEEEKRVADYDRWKNTKVKGQTNESRMKEWSDINREFKKRGEEGRVHTINDLRERKTERYD